MRGSSTGAKNLPSAASIFRSGSITQKRSATKRFIPFITDKTSIMAAVLMPMLNMATLPMTLTNGLFLARKYRCAILKDKVIV